MALLSLYHGTVDQALMSLFNAPMATSLFYLLVPESKEEEGQPGCCRDRWHEGGQ